MAKMTITEICKVRGCTRGTAYRDIEKGKLVKNDEGKIDTAFAVNKIWLSSKTKGGADSQKRKHNHKKEDPEKLLTDLVNLDEKKIAEQIKYIKKQGRKLDLQYDTDKKDLIHTSLIGLFIGHFATGIKTNFLTISQKISRGDTELRDRIEKMIKIAIQKTIEGAEMGLAQDGIKLLDPNEIIENETNYEEFG